MYHLNGSNEAYKYIYNFLNDFKNLNHNKTNQNVYQHSNSNLSGSSINVNMENGIYKNVERRNHPATYVYDQSNRNSINLPINDPSKVKIPIIIRTGSSYELNQTPITPQNKAQKLLVARHGERVDTIFGRNWISSAFDPYGNYIRFDSRMPKSLIKRDNPFDFDFDPPLTSEGLEKARRHGKEMAKNGITIKHMYSSPALRSIQTADKILEGFEIKGMNLKGIVPIKVEPGLFEVMSWQLYIPNKYPFISLNSLRNDGINVDMDYTPMVPYELLMTNETIYDFYYRMHFLAKKITDKHEAGNIMLVGHAPTLEASTRQLRGDKPKLLREFSEITRKVNFLSTIQLEKSKDEANNTKWTVITPIPLIKNFNTEFDPNFKKNQPELRSIPNISELANSQNGVIHNNTNNTNRSNSQENLIDKNLIKSQSKSGLINIPMYTRSSPNIKNQFGLDNNFSNINSQQKPQQLHVDYSGANHNQRPYSQQQQPHLMRDLTVQYAYSSSNLNSNQPNNNFQSNQNQNTNFYRSPTYLSYGVVY